MWFKLVIGLIYFQTFFFILALAFGLWYNKQQAKEIKYKKGFENF